MWRSLLLGILLVCAIPPTAQAQTSPPPNPRQLALPGRAFPAHARGTVLSGAEQGVLHTETPSDLGRLMGYRQVVFWRIHGRQLNMRYDASTFPSVQQAQAAAGDARASLWEMGVPLQRPTHGFLVVKQGPWREIDLVMCRGGVEAEIRLQGNVHAIRGGIPALVRAEGAAWAVAGRIVPPAPSPGSPSPPIYVAPMGTGPVVESPSRLSIPLGDDPGAFRSSLPPLAARVRSPVDLIPSAPLARFVRTARSNSLYAGTALYPSTPAASAALDSLVRENRKAHLVPSSSVSSPLLDAAFEGKIGSQDVLALGCQNVVVVLSGRGAATLDSQAGAIVGRIPSWLHAQGTSIVDAAGSAVQLDGVNWYGAESPDFVVGGLDYQSYQKILQTIQDLGYNTVRLPFSNQLVEQNPVVTAHLAANPTLAGLHALDILDRIVAYAGAIGLHVILDDHRSEAGWSSEPLWYTQQYPQSSFDADWVTMARRYADDDAVIAADLRNEPHGSATWGGDPSTDWHAAAEQAGDMVLAVNPHILIMVEGVEFYGNAPSAWWGGNLMGVQSDPVALEYPDGTSARSQLVYSPHDYGPDNCGNGCPWFSSTTTAASLDQIWDSYWGYIAADPSQPYAAPIWLGEFGTCNNDPTCILSAVPGSQGQWFAALVQYVQERNLGWAYWSVNGTQSTGTNRSYGTPEGYGLLNPDWASIHPVFLHALPPSGQATSPN